MSERVMVYTSASLSFETLSQIIHEAGGTPADPSNEADDILGRMEEEERSIMISGSRKLEDPYGL